MDSLSTPIVSAAKLPILNPNEFDLWKMRIEQYFLMTDYLLWEVIINGDSPAPTIVVDGVVQPVTIMSSDQKLARRNELKACGTLLIALPDKHQLKFNSHKDAKTLMVFENVTGSSSKNFDQIHDRLQKLVSQLEIHGVSLSQEDVNLKFLCSQPSEWKTYTLIWRNKANLEKHSLNDLFNSLKIYETKVRHSFSPGNPTQNLAFVSSSNTDSTTDSVSVATSVFDVCAKLPVSSHPNIDSLSNAVIFSFFTSQSTSPQLDNDDLKQIDVDELEEMDLRWQMAMLTMRARRECRSPKDTRRTGTAKPQRRNAPVETSTSNALVSQCDGIGRYDWSYQADEEHANFALMVITSSSSSSDNEVQSCSKACSKAYDQLHSQYDKLTVEFYKSQIDVLSYQAESDSESLSPSCLSDRLRPNGGYNVVPPPITRNFMPPKPDLVFHTAPIAVETDHSAFTAQLCPAKPAQDLSHTTRPMEPIIEDWVCNSEDESEPNDLQSVPSFVQTSEHVKSFGHSDQFFEAPILAATPKPTSPKTNRSGKRKNKKTYFVCRSVDHLIKDCNFHAKPKPQPTPRNYAHKGYTMQNASFTQKHPQKHIVPAAVLTKSKPVYVTTVGPVSADVHKIMMTRPKHAHSIDTKSKSTFRRHITRSLFLRTSNSPPKVTAAKASVGNPQYALKDKGVIDSGCSRHMTGNMSYLSDFQELNGGYVAFGGNPKGSKISGKGKIKTGKFEGKDEGFLVGYSVNSKSFRVFNSRTRIVQETLHVNFLENKPNITGTGPTWLFDIDSLTRTMNYQPVIAGNQSNPSAGFQETFDAEKAREEANQQYMLFPVWSTGSSNPQNKEGDAAFDEKEHDAEKPESAVNLSLGSRALSGEQDDMTKKKNKEKSHVEYFTGNRDLNTDFQDYSEDSSNDVSVAGPIVPTAGSMIGSLMYLTSSRPDIMFAWPTQTMIMLVQAWTENIQLEDVNSLDADRFLGNAKSKQLLPLHPQRLNM
nr:hypothetical protein [Tanacetum cinerariifolium]